jgi:hypothetical protein
VDLPPARAEERLWRERLRVPVWWHLGVVCFVAIFGTELAQIMTARWLQVLTYLILFALGELLLWRAGHGVVEVTDTRIRVGTWALPLAQIRSVEPLTGPAGYAALREGGEDVYRYVRGWVHGLVRLEVDDPEDVPVWLFSTRNPRALAGAVVRARERAVPGSTAVGYPELG